MSLHDTPSNHPSPPTKLRIKWGFKENLMKPIELYSLATPNGQKVSIALEEMEIPYNAHTINILKGEQLTPEFLAINPNGKIPAIIDPEGDQGKPLTVFESGAILIYLAKKAQKFLPPEPKLESETLQWLFFQVGGVGPMFGQFGHFYKYAKEKCDHPYPLERYTNESKRLLGVLDHFLNDKSYLVGEQYTIADMATVPWVYGLSVHYNATEALNLSQFKNVNRWVNSILERPKTKAGLSVCDIL